MVAVSAVQVDVVGVSPRAGVTVTGLGVGDSVVSVWRVADGERNPVRGARRVAMSDSNYVVDYDVPLGRPVVYEVEVISGPSGASRATAAPVTVVSDSAWLMDPLIPDTAVEIVEPREWQGRPSFAAKAMAALEYGAEVSLFRLMGGNKPMSLHAPRQAATGVDLSMITDAADESIRLRDLLLSTSTLLLRIPASWQNALPGSVFVSVATVSEQPLENGLAGSLTVWELAGDTVAAPTIRVLTASFTYGDVELLFSTYGQKQDMMSGRSYLDDLKNPLGG